VLGLEALAPVVVVGELVLDHAPNHFPDAVSKQVRPGNFLQEVNEFRSDSETEFSHLPFGFLGHWGRL
jgi:hypothetical protein